MDIPILPADLSNPVPDICESVLYKWSHHEMAIPHRVEGWYKVKPEILIEPEDEEEKMIWEICSEERERRIKNGIVRVIPCKRNEAQYIAIYAIAGAIIRIDECKRKGVYVQWSHERIQQQIESANRWAEEKYHRVEEIRA
jgi:hypothetical protein